LLQPGNQGLHFLEQLLSFFGYALDRGLSEAMNFGGSEPKGFLQRQSPARSFCQPPPPGQPLSKPVFQPLGASRLRWPAGQPQRRRRRQFLEDGMDCETQAGDASSPCRVSEARIGSTFYPGCATLCASPQQLPRRQHLQRRLRHERHELTVASARSQLEGAQQIRCEVASTFRGQGESALSSEFLPPSVLGFYRLKNTLERPRSSQGLQGRDEPIMRVLFEPPGDGRKRARREIGEKAVQVSPRGLEFPEQARLRVVDLLRDFWR
jgi:hypothetical protein